MGRAIGVDVADGHDVVDGMSGIVGDCEWGGSCMILLLVVDPFTPVEFLNNEELMFQYCGMPHPLLQIH